MDPTLPNPAPLMDALRAAQARGLLAGPLDTAGLRGLGAEILSRAVFTARCTSAAYLSVMREVINATAGGTMDLATARVTLLEALKALGYTPEGGFPDAPAGSVPPAVRGTLQDLSSFQRLDLIVNTQTDLMTGAGQQARGHSPGRLEAFPAWELIRELSRLAPRNWGGKYSAPPDSPRRHDPRPRWVIAGGHLTDNRMIAYKGDEVWGELGSSNNFDDALNVDHPPFAFRSGMGWEEVTRAECRRLNLLSTGGATLDQWEAGERPRVIAGKLPMPTPSLSMRGVSPDLRAAVIEQTGAVPSAARPDALDFSDLLRSASERHIRAYEGRGQ